MLEWEKFYNKLRHLEHGMNGTQPTLEEYLRSLLRLVKAHEQQAPSLDLFFELIKKAFNGIPEDFDPHWLNIQDPPIEELELNFGDPDLPIEIIERRSSGKEEDFAFLLQVLTFQIAELRRMSGKQLDNQYRYFGVESETGHYWYNFEPFANLESGIRGYMDNIREGKRPSEIITWKALADMIELGRIYE